MDSHHSQSESTLRRAFNSLPHRVFVTFLHQRLPRCCELGDGLLNPQTPANIIDGRTISSGVWGLSSPSPNSFKPPVREFSISKCPVCSRFAYQSQFSCSESGGQIRLVTRIACFFTSRHDRKASVDNKRLSHGAPCERRLSRFALWGIGSAVATAPEISPRGKWFFLHPLQRELHGRRYTPRSRQCLLRYL